MSEGLNQERYELTRDAMLESLRGACDAAQRAGSDPLHMGYFLISVAIGLWKGAGAGDEQIKELAGAIVENVIGQLQADS